MKQHVRPRCKQCKKTFGIKRFKAGYKLCLHCGEQAATQDRKLWCVLTPHKQGPMFFTNNFAQEAARGINNKGGLVK